MSFLGFFWVGAMGTSCTSQGDCTCSDMTSAMFPDPIDVSQDAITFEVVWEGGTSTCVADATRAECSLADAGGTFVEVLSEWESNDVAIGGALIGEELRRLPIVIGVSVEGILDEVQVTLLDSERSFSTDGAWTDSEEMSCGRSCTSRELELAAD